MLPAAKETVPPLRCCRCPWRCRVAAGSRETTVTVPAPAEDPLMEAAESEATPPLPALPLTLPPPLPPVAERR